MKSADWIAPDHNSTSLVRFLVIAAGPAGAAAAAALCGAGDYRAAFSAAVAAVGLAALLTARPSLETVLLIWFVTAPIASYYFHLPSNDPIITYDRAIFGLVGLILLFDWLPALRQARSTDGFNISLGPRLSPATYGFEVTWALLCAIALASVATQSSNPGYSMRIAVDSFCLPLIAFHSARSYPEARCRSHALLIGAAAALALFLFACGAYEFVTRTDLFPFEGSQLVRESEIRVNGPFNSDSSYAVVCVTLAIFLRAAPRLFAVRLDRSARVVYWSAFASALAASLLPLYRVVGVALVISWIIVEAALSEGRRCTRNRHVSKAGFSIRAMAGAAVLLIGLATAGWLLQSSQGRLASARNLYSRLATWEAAAGIAVERPLFGVGLTNYNEYFNKRYSRADQWQSAIGDARPMAYPHSNALWIGAELGLGAFALYVLANLFLFLIGYRGWRQAESSLQKSAAGCFLALLAAYSIPGLTLTSGAYSDLNLYFFLFLGLVSRRLFIQGEDGLSRSVLAI
jgi:hypothetical protein